MPVFKIGDPVRVKEGVMSSEISSQCIGGWQGRVLEILHDYDGEETVVIELDSLTLRSMSPSYIYESWLSYLDCLIIELPPGDIEPAAPRDTEEDVAAEAEEIKRAAGLLAKAGQDVPAGFYQVWADYLYRIARFPFGAEVCECLAEHPFREGDRVEVRGIDSADDYYGLIAEVWDGRDKFYFPLCALKAVYADAQNQTAVADYREWFNRYGRYEAGDA